MRGNGLSNGRALANPVPISQSCANRSIRCQSANPLPILCQSRANPAPLVSLMPFLNSPELPILISSHSQSLANPGQSGANPSPLVSLVPFLTSPELPILISSHGQSLANPGQSGPLGGRIQDNRAFPILTKPFHCQCTANAV